MSLSVNQDVWPDNRLLALRSGSERRLIYWVRRNAKWFLKPLDEIAAGKKPHSEHAFGGPGIYFLFRANALGYIGMAQSVDTRLRGHHAKYFYCSEPLWFDAVSAVWCPDPILRDVEAYYIQKFNPPRNSARPRVPFYLEKYL